MVDIIKNIITNVLTALYHPFGFSVLLAVLFMFLYLYAMEHGWKESLLKWWSAFRTDVTFRRTFFLAFYTAMILFRTLLNRNLWLNPLSNVMGGWFLHNDKGELSTEPIENLMLFIPFVVLLLWAFRDKLLGENHHSVARILCQSVKVTFVFSLGIEFAQLFLRLGTFQLADLFYNTLGGLIGGVVYAIFETKINSV
ncbi:MAG: VanZ family protein [Erysipelotrichaceae bacterium]|nr:VanZ family protein [Erysipelotrichaceae bacterium]